LRKRLRHEATLFGFLQLLFLFFVVLSLPAPAFAGIFGTVRGIVPRCAASSISGRPSQLQAKSSDWRHEALSDDEGKFQFDAVPAGDYTIRISRDGFREYSADLTLFSRIPLRSGTSLLSWQASPNKKVEVSEKRTDRRRLFLSESNHSWPRDNPVHSGSHALQQSRSHH